MVTKCSVFVDFFFWLFAVDIVFAFHRKLVRAFGESSDTHRMFGTHGFRARIAASISATAVLATLGTVVAQPAAGAVTSPSVGVALPQNEQVGMFEDLQYLTGTALDSRLDQYAATGVRFARFQMIWGTVQPTGPSGFSWSNYEALVKGLVARGITPLAVLDTSPAWDRAVGCTQGLTCAPADPTAYANFASAAATHFAPLGLHDWELWNEPNTSTFWGPTPDPEAYAALVRAAYPAIKAADAAATVITGGLAPAIDTPSTVAPLEFLQRVYTAGGAGSFDAVGWHPYTYPAAPGVVDDGSAWYQMYGSPTNVRSMMIAHGDGSKKVWTTEFGAPTDPADTRSVTPDQQAKFLQQALALWSGYSWAGPFIAYQYQDRGTDTADRENFFGMTDASGVAKPALGAFEAAIAGFDLAASGVGVPSAPASSTSTTAPPTTAVPVAAVAPAAAAPSAAVAPQAVAPVVAAPTPTQRLSGPGVVDARSTPTPAAPATGYRMIAADGGVFSFGSPFYGSDAGVPTAAMATTDGGYWLSTPGGSVRGYGAAVVAPASGGRLGAPVAGLAGHGTDGFWLVGADGSVEAHGSAPFLGSLAGAHLAHPIVGVAATPSGNGYWLVGSDGGVFCFGDAAYDGSTGALTLAKPIVGLTPTPSGHGYWLVASDGGVFAFGDAGFLGSTGAIRLNRPVVGITATSSGHGYWLVASDGGVFAFGDAGFLGSTGGLRLAQPVIGLSRG